MLNMNKQITQTLGNKVRRGSALALLAGFLLINTVPVYAQIGDQPFSNPVEIKYLGSNYGKMSFQVEFENQNEENLEIAIKDEQGYVLFKEQFKDKKFSKKFQIDRNELGDSKLILSVNGAKEKQAQVYQINTNYRIVEDVVVTKL
jgi:hypothetical protein